MVSEYLLCCIHLHKTLKWKVEFEMYCSYSASADYFSKLSPQSLVYNCIMTFDIKTWDKTNLQCNFCQLTRFR